jgi:hypothetical protein
MMTTTQGHPNAQIPRSTKPTSLGGSLCPPVFPDDSLRRGGSLCPPVLPGASDEEEAPVQGSESRLSSLIFLSGRSGGRHCPFAPPRPLHPEQHPTHRHPDRQTVIPSRVEGPLVSPGPCSAPEAAHPTTGIQRPTLVIPNTPSHVILSTPTATNCPMLG